MPLTFRDIVGHRRVTQLLSNAVARDTVPQTLLLTGPAGVGKFRVAEVTAAALNCLSPVPDASGFPIDACGSCRSCDRVTRRVHVDVIAIEPDDRSSIKIDVVRDLLERSTFRPFEGRRRVVMLRDADTLEVPAQNALLKSLEEPPPSTTFVLTTALPATLLPTVRSRCMVMRFARLTDNEVADVLTREHGMELDEARAASVLADGSVAQALAYGSTDVAVLRETALLMLRQAAATGSASVRLQTAAVVATGSSKKERTRDEIAIIVRMTASMLRDIELLNSHGDAGALANVMLKDELRSLTRAFSGSRARDAFMTMDRALVALERNAGVKVVADWVTTQI